MFKLKDILDATGGKEVSSGPVRFGNISTDSRTIGPGELFVPLTGPNFDGHGFIDAAFKKGAAGTLVKKGTRLKYPEGKTVIEVGDTLRALQETAHFIRMKRTGIPVIGVTGTNGKTTTKEMLASILSVRGPVLKNDGNLNNEIGVPLTLLRLEKRHLAAVIEMGMSALGEIARLAEIAAPSIGIITNIGPGHLGSLGSMDAVARAKGELVLALPEDGKAILNGDDPYLKNIIEENRHRTLTFGITGKADIAAADIKESDSGISFKLIFPGGTEEIALPVIGLHNVYNALAASAAALAAGADAANIKEGLGAWQPVKMRMEITEIDGARIINDAYNANPASMAAALNALASIKGSRKMAVLGDMLELGKAASKSHFDVGRMAGAQDLTLLILTGGHAPLTAQGAMEAGMPEERIFIVESPTAAAAILAERLKPGDHVLIKGSRSMKMERVVDLLRGRSLVA
ncbi:MAG: UDP-N-acetylmuramoyl-tripeptide--D-alanyl-D-alanine ligase [Nitrospirota bacterium]